METASTGRAATGDRESPQQRVGRKVRELRTERGLSLADLASATGGGRGWINNVEAGRRWATDRRWVVLADGALHAEGELTAVWDRAKAERDDAETLRRTLAASVKEARALLTEPDVADVDELHAEAVRLNVAYLSSPPAPMLEAAVAVQREALRRLRAAGQHSSATARDLQVIAGRAGAVLSYAALDLGDSAAAAVHAQATFALGDRANDDGLRAWARGTQSLIARFDKDYAAAAQFVQDGLQYATVGTSRARLLSGGAQCAANLGDASTALTLLDRAAEAHDAAAPDPVEGLLGFSPAKLRYYGGSSLMWLDDPAALRRAASDATAAIEIWEHEPPEQRSSDDEALAHVYLARARIRLGDLDGGMAAVQPVLALPPERVISWIRRRVGDLSDSLRAPYYAGSNTAGDAYEDLRAFGGSG